MCLLLCECECECLCVVLRVTFLFHEVSVKNSKARDDRLSLLVRVVQARESRCARALSLCRRPRDDDLLNTNFYFYFLFFSHEEDFL